MKLSPSLGRGSFSPCAIFWRLLLLTGRRSICLIQAPAKRILLAQWLENYSFLLWWYAQKLRKLRGSP